MPWHVAIIISLVLYSCSTLLQRYLLRNNDTNAVAVSLFFQGVTAVIIALIGTALGQIHIPDLRPIVLQLAVMGLLYGLGNIFIFRSLKQLEASRFTILFASRSIFTIIASSLFLHEGLTLVQITGAACIFLGIILVHSRAVKFSFHPRELMAICAAACFGLANTNDRIILGHLNVFTYVFLAFLIPTIVVAVLRPHDAKQVPSLFTAKLLPKLLLLCLFYTGSSLAFFSALQSAPNSSQVAAVNVSSVILIVLFSAVFLHERTDLPKKITAAILTFIGLLLIS